MLPQVLPARGRVWLPHLNDCVVVGFRGRAGVCGWGRAWWGRWCVWVGGCRGLLGACGGGCGWGRACLSGGDGVWKAPKSVVARTAPIHPPSNDSTNQPTNSSSTSNHLGRGVVGARGEQRPRRVPRHRVHLVRVALSCGGGGGCDWVWVCVAMLCGCVGVFLFPPTWDHSNQRTEQTNVSPA